MSRKNKFFIIIGELFFLSLILFVLPTIFLKEKPGVFQTSFENILPLDKNHTYNQEFISNSNNLSSISVLIKNPGLLSNDYVYIDVQDRHKNILQSLSTTGFSIGDPSWIDFKFPIINSKIGDTFYINITSNSQKDNNLYIYGNLENNNINFKTTFTDRNFKESIQSRIKEYKEKYQLVNKKFLFSYIFIILTFNILIFSSYEFKKK